MCLSLHRRAVAPLQISGINSVPNASCFVQIIPRKICFCFVPRAMICNRVPIKLFSQSAFPSRTALIEQSSGWHCSLHDLYALNESIHFILPTEYCETGTGNVTHSGKHGWLRWYDGIRLICRERCVFYFAASKLKHDADDDDDEVRSTVAIWGQQMIVLLCFHSFWLRAIAALGIRVLREHVGHKVGGALRVAHDGETGIGVLGEAEIGVRIRVRADIR